MALPQTPPTSPRPVLLISGGPVTQPLWPGLAEKYDLAFLQPQPAQIAMELSLPCFAIAQIIDDNVREKSNNDMAHMTARIVAGMPKIHARVNELLPTLHPAALNSKLPDWFAGYIAQHITWQTQYLAALDVLAANRKVIGCLTHEDVAPDTRLMVAWSRTHNVPTVHLPHANCHLLPGVRDIHRETRTDWILAHGEYMRQFYIESGFPEDRIRITGNPVSDALYGDFLPSRGEARRVMGLPEWEDTDLRLWLCYVSTWGQTTSLRSEFDAEFDAGLKAVLEFVKARNIILEILVHRSSAPNVEQVMTKALTDSGITGLVTRQHFNYVIRAADVVIAQGPSNVCLEAVTMGTSACYIQTEGFDYAHDVIPRGGAGDVQTLVEQVLSGRNWNEFIAYYNAAHPDGHATDRALEAVLEICR